MHTFQFWIKKKFLGSEANVLKYRIKFQLIFFLIWGLSLKLLKKNYLLGDTFSFTLFRQAHKKNLQKHIWCSVLLFLIMLECSWAFISELALLLLGQTSVSLVVSLVGSSRPTLHNSFLFLKRLFVACAPQSRTACKHMCRIWLALTTGQSFYIYSFWWHAQQEESLNADTHLYIFAIISNWWWLSQLWSKWPYHIYRFLVLKATVETRIYIHHIKRHTFLSTLSDVK